MQQHGHRQQADAAGDGRDLAGHFLDGLEVHVADQPVVGAVHAHVDHHGARLDHVGRDELRPADGHDQDVGLARDRGQVARAAVADGHRGVAAGPLLHEHRRHRLAHDVAAAHDHHVGPGDLDVVPHEQLLNAVRRAGQKPRAALHHPAHVLGMKAVDVLGRARPRRARGSRRSAWAAATAPGCRGPPGRRSTGRSARAVRRSWFRPAAGACGWQCRPSRTPSPCFAHRLGWPDRCPPAPPPGTASRPTGHGTRGPPARFPPEAGPKGFCRQGWTRAWVKPWETEHRDGCGKPVF